MWSFHTIYKPTIWGGRLIADLKGIEPPFAKIGESWEISAIPGSVSVVKSSADTGESINGLVRRHGARLVGEKNYRKYGDRFPILVKFIDAASDLSVQVHPDPEMAAEEGLPNGKAEMWYVIDRLPGAKIANGFSRPVNPEVYHELLESGDIENWLRYTETHPGMAFFIPPGRVHAIGGGNLICEIQETCDTTYRIYDYRRRDSKGQLRELHTEKAFRALDFGDCGGETLTPVKVSDEESELVDHSQFRVNLLETSTALCRNYSGLDSFVILVAVKGDISLSHIGDSEIPGVRNLYLREGEAALIPAVARGLTIEPKDRAILLETYIDF